jgi:prepilin-type processing-associated H-X9-DG protein
LLVSDKLVGRAEEIQLVTKFLRSVARSGEALLLLGEPGVGKTVLLDAGAEEASAMGFQILRLAGVEYEADVSYSGLNQCLLPVIEAMDGLSAAHHEAISVALGLDSGPAAVTARSYHSGGANSLFCGASVRFIKNSINWATWRVLGTVGRGRQQ